MCNKKSKKKKKCFTTGDRGMIVIANYDQFLLWHASVWDENYPQLNCRFVKLYVYSAKWFSESSLAEMHTRWTMNGDLIRRHHAISCARFAPYSDTSRSAYPRMSFNWKLDILNFKFHLARQTQLCRRARKNQYFVILLCRSRHRDLQALSIESIYPSLRKVFSLSLCWQNNIFLIKLKLRFFVSPPCSSGGDN